MKKRPRKEGSKEHDKIMIFDLEMRDPWRRMPGHAQEPWPVFPRTGNFKDRHSTNQCNFLPNLAVLNLLGREDPLNIVLAAEQVNDIPDGYHQCHKSLTLVSSTINPLHDGFSSASPLTAAILSFLLVLLSKL